MRLGLLLGLVMAAPTVQAPLAGGWSVVERPTDDHDVRAAAVALVRHLPVKNVGLRRIESASRQVVAGTNFRLTVRLTSGSTWRGVVWHKLNGDYVVSHMARVRSPS